MIQSPLGAYKETRVRTASPGQLIVMLYNEAVKQCDTALDYMTENVKKKPQNIEKINQAVNKVQDIVTELMASLDFEAGGDIARDLFALYVFFNRELMEANIAKDGQRIRSVRNLLDELRQAWVQAAAQTGGVGGEGQAGVNIAG
ncbi:MAG: flagellar export chaperone FliS [Spirochaetes bacterium GWD1_61_31]|nr:MAG: flagellar export chaperone FliS [Spirochaetes bacterium GWB1_60_80]OHD34401.1 MAG: flagellar export chaperone FliS [Spirochaetes bacterium GWC1_61_12]OHD35666.1 MAG: flagellar export chaperone FliS [Spirochaetes bacterium GWD1_61_31]OHD41648.1 MAG: flagellar export chaperone FliS [Spirochaetes bacterium GWE1_60_18]OHD61691.1 MAG: flagellar export chaperone FliS [Spirochaetes bacterium GWF1_60_12]HAP42889.1 flagellar export chaperone FliS [Spirochaetaceae bacterium]